LAEVLYKRFPYNSIQQVWVSWKWAQWKSHFT